MSFFWYSKSEAEVATGSRIFRNAGIGKGLSIQENDHAELRSNGSS